MGYTGTTNYGFQKPAKENAFTVDDLNNALDKIDETIKDESLSSLSVDIDDDMNLIVKLTSGDGSEIEDSTSLMAISGVLIVQDELANATMTVVRTATNQQVYNGAVTPQSIATGAGSIKVKITQFGSNIEKDIQVAGETLLVLTNDLVTVTPPTDAVSWTFKDISMPLTSIQVLKGVNGTVRTVFGNWDNSHEMYAEDEFTFNSDSSIQHDYSNVYEITKSGTFVAPIARQYEIIAIGGGGGGGGGGKARQLSSRHIGGGGGGGGNSGAIKAWRENLTKNQSVNVTIGQGGSGGNAGTSSHGGIGVKGGSTIFGSTSVSGGSGGSGGVYGDTAYYDRVTGTGGEGGDGGNGTDIIIFGESKTYGKGGEGGNPVKANPPTGEAISGGIGRKGGNYVIDNILKKYPEDPYVDFGGGGGDGGNGGKLYMWNFGGTVGTVYEAGGGNKGEGGEGLLIRIDNVTTRVYGYGGDGGDGGDCSINPGSGEVEPSNGRAGSAGDDGYILLRAVL